MSTAELLIKVMADTSGAQTAIGATSDRLRQMAAAAGGGTSGVKAPFDESVAQRIEQIAPALQNASARAKEAHPMMGRFGEELNSIGRAAVGMATGMVAANITMGIAERFKSAAEQIDHYGKAVLQVQRITGQSAESSSLLVAMFERFAPSVDAAITRLARFEKALAGQEDVEDAVVRGGKKAGDFLREFGVQATTAAGTLRPTTDILLDLAEGFKNSGDTAQKNGALVALFGRGSEDMLKMLNQGREGLLAFMAEAKKYGMVLSEENLADVKEFIKAHKDMDMALQGVSLQLGAAFMPAITNASKSVASFAQTINTSALPAIKALGDVHLDWIAPATAGVLLLGSALMVLKAIIVPLAAVFTSTFAVIAGAAFVFMQPLLNTIDSLYKLKDAIKDIPDSAFNPVQRVARDVLNSLPERTASAASAPEVTAAVLPEVQTAGPGIKTATAAKDAATSKLEEINLAAAARKSDFEIAHVDAERNALNLKMQQSAAEAELIGYKRQLEDLDRNAINFARQRLQLDQEAAVLNAQQSASPLKAANEDIRYQEEVIKAKLKAAHAGGPAVDSADLHKQLRDLQHQDARMQPGLLAAEHNVTLANRAKQATDLDASVDANVLGHKKLDVTEASAPATAAAINAARAAEDAQRLLAIEKERFAYSEMAFTAEKMLAEAAQKAAEHTLFVLEHPIAQAPAGPLGPTMAGRQATAESPTSYNFTPHPTGPVVNVNVGNVEASTGEDMWQSVKGQFIAAWNAAMQSGAFGLATGGAYGSAPGSR